MCTNKWFSSCILSCSPGCNAVSSPPTPLHRELPPKTLVNANTALNYPHNLGMRELAWGQHLMMCSQAEGRAAWGHDPSRFPSLAFQHKVPTLHLKPFIYWVDSPKERRDLVWQSWGRRWGRRSWQPEPSRLPLGEGTGNEAQASERTPLSLWLLISQNPTPAVATQD